MCIFCGGQCGGAGEFFIAIGLPFLALYFFRIKNSLVRLKNRIFRGGQSTEAEPVKCGCGGEPRQDCRGIQAQSLDPEDLELLELTSPQNAFAEVTTASTRLNNQSPLVKESILGVKGWLLLLCLNLTLFIPASYLYQINCGLNLFNSARNRILLLMLKPLLLYNLLTIAAMVGLSIFSFYAGMRLWNLKSRAVKTVKAFLFTQLLLIVVITLIQPIITLTIGPKEKVFGAILVSLIPSFLQFSLWYLYLTKSNRVRNTYSAG